jgi:hypothetical protein
VAGGHAGVGVQADGGKALALDGAGGLDPFADSPSRGSARSRWGTRGTSICKSMRSRRGPERRVR